MKQRGRVRTDVRQRAGSTLVVVALLMAAIAMLSLSFLTVLQSAQKENASSREGLAALYVCEAGLTAAVDDLMRGGTGDLGTPNQPVAMGDARYWVEADAIGDGRIQLRSFGRDDRARMGVELVVQPSSQGFFRWAAFGDEIVHMDSNARTDSYNSGIGPYDASNGSGSNAYDNTEGDVGSNGSITMDSNIGVWGDAHPGPSGSVSGDLSKISGNTTPLPETIELPDIVVPVIASSGALTVSSALHTLASGDYRFTSLQVNSSKMLRIIGPARIVCDNFKLKSNSTVEIDASAGKVEFFVIDDFVLNSNTTIHSTTESPLDVAFNLLSDNILDPGIDVSFDEDLVDFDSGSRMFGTIYAPNAEITIDSNFELFGSLIARRVDLNSNCRIHYDELLATASEDAEVIYQALCWRLLAQP